MMSRRGVGRTRNCPDRVMDQGLSFFERVEQAWFDVTQAGTDITDRFYMIGGLTLHLRIASHLLTERLTPALAHLAIPAPAAPALTVLVWDANGTPHDLPTGLWT